MMPVDQTTFGVPKGNCFSACVASLLHLPITEVPSFCEEALTDGWDGSGWPGNFIQWLHDRGWFPVFTEGKFPKEYGEFYWIAGGPSSRGPHAVVMSGDSMVHDPHPSRGGIREIEDATVLVPIDPGAWRHAR
jgi:hypothetical protein